MRGILHILKTEPDDRVQAFIESISGAEGVTVVALYPDPVSEVPVNWSRLVDDIFGHDKIICWD